MNQIWSLSLSSLHPSLLTSADRTSSEFRVGISRARRDQMAELCQFLFHRSGQFIFASKQEFKLADKCRDEAFNGNKRFWIVVEHTRPRFTCDEVAFVVR